MSPLKKPTPPPEKIGPYQVGDQIGAGGMGKVYRGYDRRLDRPVALKHIRADTASSSARERFRREARSVARLNHPAIVQVYDWVETEEGDWLIMELVEGKALKRLLLDQGPMDAEAVIEMARQILTGLAIAHSAGIVHRDLKPDNIMLTDEMQVKILDFGLAKRLETVDSETALTIEGRLLGTVSAMSPEQAVGEMVDPRSDLFSLGTLLYEALTAVSPFHSENKVQTLTRICTLQQKSVTELKPEVAAELSDVVEHLLQKDPNDRPHSAFEVLSALDRIDLTAKPEPEPELPTPQAPDPMSSSLDGLSASVSESTPSMSMASGSHYTDFTETSQPALSLHPSVGSSVTIGSVTESMVGPPISVTFKQEGEGERVLTLENRRRSLLDLGMQNEIPFYNECGGRARCSTCRIRVLDGADHILPRKPREAKLAKRLGWADEIRLACQTRVVGDVVVERLVRDTQDVGLLLDEHAQTVPAQEVAIALLSCELLNFETYAEKAPPYDQIHLLHRFLSQMGNVIAAGHGQIQTYSGTGFRAFFGLDGGSAGEKCLAAVRAALRIADRMQVFNRYAQSYFGSEMTLGVGLHFARLVVGQFGHPSRKQLLAIGDAGPLVDSVGRHNAMAGTTILATEDLINIVEDEVDLGDYFPEEPLSPRPTTLYEVYDLSDPDPIFIVQTTFEHLAARTEEAADLFYSTVFEIDPAAEALFAHLDMSNQGQKLMSLLTTAINGLEKMDEMRPYLRELGERHIGYGVEPEHYPVVGQALLHTVETMAGTKLNPRVREAWQEFYAELVSLMLPGA